MTSSASSSRNVVGFSRCSYCWLMMILVLVHQHSLSLVYGFGLDATTIMLPSIIMPSMHHADFIMSSVSSSSIHLLLMNSVHQAASTTTCSTLMDNTVCSSTSLSVALSSSPLTATSFSNTIQMLYASYTHALHTQQYALITKMMTGAILAVLGDAIAQRCIGDSCPLGYDVKRATAFCLFDVSYRAVQHFLYPPLIQHFHGQYVMTAVNALAIVSSSTSLLQGGISTSTSPETVQQLAGAMEQTLVSQLAIIPTLYYPVFFLVTGAVQGLTMEQTISRAKETFIPLMKRNLLFWIPVQFLVFGFVPEPLQISVLIVFGLIWTIILSVVAGSVSSSSSTAAAVAISATTTSASASTTSHQGIDVSVDNINDELELEVVMAMPTSSEQQQQQQSRLLRQEEAEEDEFDVYCVTGMEPNCHIDPDNLFRPPVIHHNHNNNNKELQEQAAAAAAAAATTIN